MALVVEEDIKMESSGENLMREQPEGLLVPYTIEALDNLDDDLDSALG
jgi:hypothetical protein